MANDVIQEQWIDPIGLISDFSDVFHYLDKSRNISDNPLQIYNPVKDRYLSWINDERLNDLLSIPLTEIDNMNFVSSSQSNIMPISTITFEDKYKDSFFRTIQSTVFEPGEDNAATVEFSVLIKENKDAALKLISGYFVDSFKDERMCVKLLSLLNDYSYNELYPYSQTIALSSLSHKSSRVKSAAFNMFAHWGNRESLELLNSVEPPSEPWIRKKYKTIKLTLEERCSMLEK